MKLSELIATLQYALKSLDTGDIDVKFSTGKKDFDVEWVDIGQEWTAYPYPKRDSELDYQYIRLTGTNAKKGCHVG